MFEDGYMTIETQTPCLITCIKELNEPRYMSVGGIFDCYSKPIDVYDYNTLKDDPLIEVDTIGLKGSPTNIFKSFTPPQKGQGRMLEGADKQHCCRAGCRAAEEAHHLIERGYLQWLNLTIPIWLISPAYGYSVSSVRASCSRPFWS